MLRLVAAVVKIILASLGAGAVMRVDVSAGNLLAVVGLSPASLVAAGRAAVEWAVPNILLGLFVTVPVWMVVYMLRPPRR